MFCHPLDVRSARLPTHATLLSKKNAPNVMALLVRNCLSLCHSQWRHFVLLNLDRDLQEPEHWHICRTQCVLVPRSDCESSPRENEESAFPETKNDYTQGGKL